MPDVVAHVLNPSPGKQRQVDSCESEGSLVYNGSSLPLSPTRKRKKKKEKEKKEKKVCLLVSKGQVPTTDVCSLTSSSVDYTNTSLNPEQS